MARWDSARGSLLASPPQPSCTTCIFGTASYLTFSRKPPPPINFRITSYSQKHPLPLGLDPARTGGNISVSLVPLARGLLTRQLLKDKALHMESHNCACLGPETCQNPQTCSILDDKSDKGD